MSAQFRSKRTDQLACVDVWRLGYAFGTAGVDDGVDAGVDRGRLGPGSLPVSELISTVVPCVPSSAFVATGAESLVFARWSRTIYAGKVRNYHKHARR